MSVNQLKNILIIWILLFSVTTTTRNCLKLVIYFVILFIESTRSGVEEYEQIEVDETAGPGPQRCKIFLNFLFVKIVFFYYEEEVLCKMHIMAYLHCRIRIRIPIPIRTTNQMATLYYSKWNFSNCTKSDSDSNSNGNGIGMWICECKIKQTIMVTFLFKNAGRCCLSSVSSLSVNTGPLANGQ